MSTRAPKWTALAIATDCRSPPDSVPTGWSTSRMSMPMAAQFLAGHLRGPCATSKRRNGPGPGRLGAEEEVPPDRHQRDHRQVLVDGGDAAVQRLARAAEAHRAPSTSNSPRVVLVHPGEDLDQRRLAGAVVAEHAGDLARPHGVDTSRSAMHRAEVLADVADLEQGAAAVTALISVPPRRSAGQRLASAASSSIAPRKNLNQSASQPRRRCPCRPCRRSARRRRRRSPSRSRR